jgi:hypothetical protein
MIVFTTLGHTGSNHEQVTRRYLALHGIDDAAIVLIKGFDEALCRMDTGEVDCTLQAALHPSATKTAAVVHFEHDIHVIDAFVFPSRRLAVLTRADAERPRSLGLQPATEQYVVRRGGRNWCWGG